MLDIVFLSALCLRRSALSFFFFFFLSFSFASQKWKAMLVWLACFAYGYVVATLLESLFHDYIQHRGFFFSSSRMSHLTVHHQMSFRSHTTQFENADQQENVDSFLARHFPSQLAWVRKERYGVTLSPLSRVMFVAPFVPFLAPVYFFFGCSEFGVSLLPVFFTVFMSTVVHSYLHMSEEEAMKKCGTAMSFFLRSFLVRHIWRSHYMHHRYRNSNFNLVPGGDFMRGKYRTPTERDLEMMSELGIPTR